MVAQLIPMMLRICLLVAIGAAVLTPDAGYARPKIHYLSSSSSTQLPTARPEFRHPAERHQVFFVQRTSNANTIVYVARFDDDGQLNKHRPVDVYWRRFEEQGQIMPLRWYERVFGFGVRTRAMPDGKSYQVSFNAMRSETLMLRQTGPFEAALWTRLGNRDFELIYGYLDLDESGMLPKVERLRLYTADPKTGRFVTHLIAVSGGEYQE
ncbi:DUF4833 domain-containing protein [Shimia abyssi]|uniref:Uncharacterized protein DUF4833 n=1 Tax=Shimia abyssi TaxID=1662395 RepID=A0A2P8FAQ7_9RHOB|nr:DUF4833 domain-containing protein [Shimia abyssi]PSL18742.1 uncharacterized protein DUF4833 [Shimia abyssi]